MGQVYWRSLLLEWLLKRRGERLRCIREADKGEKSKSEDGAMIAPYACGKNISTASANADDGKRKIKDGMEKRTANMKWPLVGHDSRSCLTPRLLRLMDSFISFSLSFSTGRQYLISQYFSIFFTFFLNSSISAFLFSLSRVLSNVFSAIPNHCNIFTLFLQCENKLFTQYLFN